MIDFTAVVDFNKKKLSLRDHSFQPSLHLIYFTQCKRFFNTTDVPSNDTGSSKIYLFVIISTRKN